MIWFKNWQLSTTISKLRMKAITRNWSVAFVTSYNLIGMPKSKYISALESLFFNEIENFHFVHSRLVNQFNQIHRFSIFILISWGIFGVCSSLLTLQAQLVEYFLSIFVAVWLHNISFRFRFQFFVSCKADANSSPVELIISTLIVFWTFFALFLICESGDRISQAFGRSYYELAQFDWYLFPTDIRRLYLLFLLDTQQPINLHCFARILCARDTFKRVIHLNRFLVWLEWTTFLKNKIQISCRLSTLDFHTLQCFTQLKIEQPNFYNYTNWNQCYL